MAAINNSQRSLLSEDSGLDAGAMEDHTDILVSEAQDLLDKHQLDEAEVLFSRVLHDLHDANPEKERIALCTLTGLGEIYTKRGRSMRYNLLEWYRMLLQAITFQEEAQVLCQKILDEPAEASTLSMTWLEDTRNKSSMQLNVLENTVVNSLQNNVKHVLGKNRRTQDKTVDLQAGWLLYLCNHCCEDRNKVEEQNLDDIITAAESEESLDIAQNQPVIHRKIDFDKVQSAIMTLVKEITSNVRSRSRRRKVPEETLKRSLSCEMMNKLSPTYEHSDIMSLFENAIIYEEKEPALTEVKAADADAASQGEDEAYVNDPYPMQIIHSEASDEEEEEDMDEAMYSQETIPYDNELIHARPSSSMTPSSSIHSFKGQNVPLNRVKRMHSVSGDSHKHRSKLKRSHTLPPRLGRRPSEEISGEKFDISGVITVWRSYKMAPPMKHPRRYTLSSYEEMSSLTETAKFFEIADLDEKDEESVVKYLDQNLTSIDRMKNTLACMLSKVAEKLQREPRLKEAMELNKFALGLFQELPVSQLNPNVIGTVLKNVGKIKCAQGDMEGGSQLMEEAMALFGADEEDNIHVAETLFELGNAYMAEHWKDYSLFEHVLKLVKNDMDNEFQMEIHSEVDATGDDTTDSECSDSGESYTVCTHEAMCCYKQALEILSRLRKQNEEYTTLYVDVLTKLADCNIMINDYDKAVLCYEEALYLFRNTLGSTSLPNNAHVLSMLGTANFLLSNYPKAVTMYETAHILQQHLIGESPEEASFESTFTLTMLGICFYTMRNYQKCVGWCMRAYETYNILYKDRLVDVKSLNKWFIIQTIYTLGFSYGTLNFYDKALQYLFLSNFILQQSEDRDIKQLVRVLKSVADVYNSMDDHTNALTYYDEALEESHKLGDEKTATALQNQLLNKIAGVHVSTRQYSTAAEYLEKALDYQKNVQSSIRGDLLGILHQLGITYTLSGDIDRAIECYKECVETYQELHGSPASHMSRTLCNLGTLYHVKACIQDEGDDMEEEYLNQAEECYQEAVKLDPHSGVTVQYANFLYQQGQSGDALLTMLPILFCKRYWEHDILVYYGVEQAVLPDHLQHEMDDMDEFAIETWVFANFLAILCFKQLCLTKDAEDCLVFMCEYITTSPIPLNHAVLGYSMLEMNMYEEAAESFLHAAKLQEAKELSYTNMCISVYLWIYSVLIFSLYWTWYELYKPFELDMPIDEPDTSHYVTELSVPIAPSEAENSSFYPKYEEEMIINDYDRKTTIEDSGYYDQTLTKQVQKEPEKEEEPKVTASSILEAVRKKTAMIRNKLEGKETDESENVDILTTIRLEAASRFAPRSKSPRSVAQKEQDISESGYGGELDQSQDEEQWVTYEETVETPAEILYTLASAQDTTQDYNMEPENNEQEEETWITEESISVETPAEILKLLELKASYVSDEPENDVEYKGGTEKYEDEWGLHSEITIEEPDNYNIQMSSEWNETATQGNTPEEDRQHSNEWITTEDVVETPLEVLKHLHSLQASAQSSYTIRPSQEAEEHQEDTEAEEEEQVEEEWVSEEVTVELPQDILRQIKAQQQGAHIPWRTDSLSGDETLEETWVTTEETVEMPAEVLDFIKEQEEKQQQQQAQNKIFNETDTLNNLHQTSTTVDSKEQNNGFYSRRYGRWSTYQEPPVQEETWKSTSRPAHSPTAIMNAINGNTQSTSYSTTYNVTENTQEYNQNEDEEEEWQTWETTEETVEAPPELLAILMQQQQQHR